MILMNIHTQGYMMSKYKIDNIKPFWDEQYKDLHYIKEPFNDQDKVDVWRKDGYVHPEYLYTGMMCKHGEKHPTWSPKIVEWLEKDFGWKDVGVNYYRMETGCILPAHSDIYKQYTKMFNLRLDQVERVLLFMEDWKSGHYFEMDGNPIMDYTAGTYAWWIGDVEHMAANIGKGYRYTLQLTGHK